MAIKHESHILMTQFKNIIVSAYACEPNKGSEPGIGWNWVLELARQGYLVNVITRKNNQTNIENTLAKLEPLDNLHFYYYDLPKWARTLKKGPFGIYFYYFFWQMGIVSLAKKIDQEKNVDLVHHLTFGVFRQPSFLWKLKKPFVFGPMGGGEMTPDKLLKSLPFKTYLTEKLRAIINHAYRYSPLLNHMYGKTDIILSRTEETKNFLPKKYHHKTFVTVDIGIINVSRNPKEYSDKLKALYVGRFLGWKGIHIALDAVNKANKESDQIEYTLIGKGPFKAYLEQKAKNNTVTFIEWVTQEELFEYYASYDCFLFPSFHDSGGSVILEAYSYGLPVICLDIGGPGKLVDNDSGFKIKKANKTGDELSSEIAELLLKLNEDKTILQSLRGNVFQKAEYYTWSNVVKRGYDIIKNNINS